MSPFGMISKQREERMWKESQKYENIYWKREEDQRHPRSCCWEMKICFHILLLRISLRSISLSHLFTVISQGLSSSIVHIEQLRIDNSIRNIFTTATLCLLVEERREIKMSWWMGEIKTKMNNSMKLDRTKWRRHTNGLKKNLWRFLIY